LDAPDRGQSTHAGIGVWERVNISVFLLWVVLLAITLLRVQDTAAVTGRQDAFAA
jgi:hypothetical protein